MSDAFGWMPARMHTAGRTVIWFHPAGTTHTAFRETWQPLTESLSDVGVESVFPASPRVSIPSGTALPDEAWYGYTIKSYGLKDKVDILETLVYVDHLISEITASGTPHEQIFLGGLGQGGFLAIEAAHCLSRPFAGVICLDGDFPLSFSSSMHGDYPIPVLLAGRRMSDSNRQRLEVQAADRLSAMGYRVERHIGAHSGVETDAGLREVARQFIERHSRFFPVCAQRTPRSFGEALLVR